MAFVGRVRVFGAQDVRFRGMVAIRVHLEAFGLGYPAGFDLHGHNAFRLFEKKFHFRRAALPAEGALATGGSQLLGNIIFCKKSLVTAKIVLEDRRRGDAAHGAQKPDVEEIEFETILFYLS